MKPVEERTKIEPIHKDAKDEFIIDADFHLHVPEENLYEYMEDDIIKEKLEKFGPPPIASNWNTQYASEVLRTKSYERALGVALTRDEITDVMDELGLDRVIVEPGTHIPFFASRYPEMKNALASAYNDYLMDKVLDVDEGIWGTLMFQQWDVDAALEELDRVGDEEGFVAAQNYFGIEELWGSYEFDPIFEKLTELELPLFLHIGAASRLDPFSPMGQAQETTTEAIVGGFGSTLICNVLSMVMTGVFDKFPTLNVAFQEAGSTWIPYTAYRADEQYQTTPGDVSMIRRIRELGQDQLQRMPSEYIFDNIYTATQPIALPNMPLDHQEAMLNACQAENTFIYTSDWPHITTDPPNWVFDNPRIDDETRARILRENVKEIIRLP